MSTEIEIRSAKIMQPLSCKCGRPITRSDFRIVGERVEIVCVGCHASVLEVQLTGLEYHEWD